MNDTQLRRSMVCHICKQALIFKKIFGYCSRCKVRIKQVNGIWHCLGKLSPSTLNAKKQYDSLFKHEFGGPTDGSYEILASFARGNRSIDISCGTGLIERLSPQTVGVDFSLTALKQAKKNGAKYLILADAHTLPFSNDSFDVAISSGNLEHFDNPQLALSEMARISKMQIVIVHKYPPIPYAKLMYQLVTNFFLVQHQPIERPIGIRELEKMYSRAGLHIAFKGVWTLPFNSGRVLRWLPEIKLFPSAWFVISIKQ